MFKKILKVSAGLIAACMLVAGGWLLKGEYDRSEQGRVTDAASQYVQDITSGKMEAAYQSAGEAITSGMTLEEFTASYGNLTTSQLEVVSTKVFKTDEGYQVYQQVENLPVTESGNTGGVFTLLVVKEGGAWKVTGGTVI